MNVDKKLKQISIAICRLIGNKLQSKTLFLAIFDLHSSIIKSVFDCRLSGVRIKLIYQNQFTSHRNVPYTSLSSFN